MVKEERRRSLDRASRRLKACETALENARNTFAQELYEAVENEKCSLGEVSKTLDALGRPISRQRVHQIISESRKEKS